MRHPWHSQGKHNGCNLPLTAGGNALILMNAESHETLNEFLRLSENHVQQHGSLKVGETLMTHRLSPAYWPYLNVYWPYYTITGETR